MRKNNKCPLCNKRMTDVIKMRRRKDDAYKALFGNDKSIDGYLFTCKNKKCRYFDHDILQGEDMGKRLVPI